MNNQNKKIVKILGVEVKLKEEPDNLFIWLLNAMVYLIITSVIGLLFTALLPQAIEILAFVIVGFFMSLALYARNQVYFRKLGWIYILAIVGVVLSLNGII
jgi:predicted anti-sigma-YlaC factor YlaD